MKSCWQVLAGGRGKGKFANYRKGGVQLVYSPDEVEQTAKGMLGKIFKVKKFGSRSVSTNY